MSFQLHLPGILLPWEEFLVSVRWATFFFPHKSAWALFEISLSSWRCEIRNACCPSCIIVSEPTEISWLLLPVKPRSTDVTFLRVSLFSVTVSLEVSDILCSHLCLNDCSVTYENEPRDSFNFSARLAVFCHRFFWSIRHPLFSFVFEWLFRYLRKWA